MKRRKFLSQSTAATAGVSLMACSPVASKEIDEIPSAERKEAQEGLSRIKPKKLTKGDTIGVITPGSGLKDGQFEKIIENIEAIGLKPKYTSNLKRHNGFLAAKDEDRLSDIHSMFSDDEVAGIICGRGGYGSARILDKIDYDLIRANPKPFIGFSDVTALLSAFSLKSGLVGFHGPVASQEFTDYTKENLKAVLMEGMANVGFGKTSEYYTITSGRVSGILAGGNLSIICSLEGTPYALDFTDKIVFIEEIKESPYRIDRMLTQLLLSGKLAKAKGIVFGDFYDCDVVDKPGVYNLKDVLTERVSSLNMPIAYGFKIGHVPDNSTIPYGIRATLDTTTNGTLTLDEKAVVG